MVEQWSPKPKVKGSNPFSPDYPAGCQYSSCFTTNKYHTGYEAHSWEGRKDIQRPAIARSDRAPVNSVG